MAHHINVHQELPKVLKLLNLLLRLLVHYPECKHFHG